MIILNTLLYVLIFLFAILLPGLLATKKLFKDVKGLESLIIGTGIGICLVSLISFSIALFFNIYLEKIIVFAVSAAIILVLIKKIPSILCLRWSKREILILILALLFLVFFLVRYDQKTLNYHCINEESIKLVWSTNLGDGSFSKENIKHDLIFKINDVRFGGVSVVSSFISLFDWFGFRLSYALMITLISLFCFLITQRVFKNFILSTLSIFLVLVPSLFNIQFSDENIIALMVSLLMVYLILKRTNYGMIGVIFGLLIGVRHIAVLFIIPILFWLYFERERKRKLISFSIWATIASLPWMIHHQLAFGNVFAHEIIYQFGLYSHQFLFWKFNFYGLLNYPFYNHIVRTPYNAFPTFLLFPATLIKDLGLIIMAFILLGLVYLFYRKRKLATFLLLWFVPLYLLLSVQENWLQPEKMNYIVTIFGPLMIWCVAGVKWLFSSYRNKLKVCLFLLFIVLGGTFIKTIQFIDVPGDQRLYEEYPTLVKETKEIYSFEKEEYNQINLFPSFKKSSYGVSGLIYNLKYPKKAFYSYPEKTTEIGGPQEIRINLSEPLIYSNNFIFFDKNVHLDLSDESLYLVSNLTLDWYDYPINLLIIRNKFNEVILYLGYDENSYFPLDPLSIAHREVDIKEIEETSIDNNQLNLKIPEKSKIILIIRLAKEETIYYLRTMEIKDSRFVINKAAKMYNN